MSNKSNKVDFLFFLDTTLSMFPAAVMTREGLSGIAKKIFDNVPDVNIAFGVHGDFCDEETTYLYKVSPLVGPENLALISAFLEGIEGTDGGDWDEAYGYIMQQVTNYPWRPDSEKHLVMVGDARFHHRGYSYGNHNSVWWEDARDELKEAGVTVHTIQCLTSERQEPWWRVLADTSGGIYAKMDQFSDVALAFISLALRHGNKEALTDFANELGEGLQNHARQRLLAAIFEGTDAYEVLVNVGGYNKAEHESKYGSGYFDTDYGDVRSSRGYYRTASRSSASRAVNYTEDSGLFAVPPDYFQILPVNRQTDIKGFVIKNGAPFEVGRGFYELGTKKVTVQEKKEIVLEDKVTGEFFSGSEARDMIGIPYGKRKDISRSNLPQDIAKKYNVFVQSTSYNRKLLPNTRFLYKPTRERLTVLK